MVRNSCWLKLNTLPFRKPNDAAYTLTSKEKNPTDFFKCQWLLLMKQTIPNPRIMKLCLWYKNDSSFISG